MARKAPYAIATSAMALKAPYTDVFHFEFFLPQNPFLPPRLFNFLEFIVKKTALSLLCLLFSLSLVACDDDDKKTTPKTETCTQSKCEGNILISCQNGVQTPLDCGDLGCDNKTLACHQPAEKCQNTYCSGNTLFQCNADGSITPISCGTVGCDDKTLACNTSACTESYCSGNILYECHEGTTTAKDCGSIGCNATKRACNEKDTSSDTDTQNNTEGASCDASFVENCQGDSAIYCDYYYNENTGKYDETTTVIDNRCNWYDNDDEGIAYTCGTWNDNGVTRATCIDKNDNDLCSEQGKEEKVCSVTYDSDLDEYLSVQMTTRCELFSDGKLHTTLIDMQYCSNICSETDGCQQTTCTLPADTSKFADVCEGNIAKFCIEFTDGQTLYLAADCELQNATCQKYDSGEAVCDTGE